MRALRSLLVLGCLFLASGCGEKSKVEGGTSGRPGAGSGGLDANGGGSASSGAGGQLVGGNGGNAGSGGAGGATDPYEGYPDWVSACVFNRYIAPCPSCLDPQCVVCTYGTDEEIEQTGAVCSATAQTYALYCDCTSCATSAGGACRYP